MKTLLTAAIALTFFTHNSTTFGNSNFSAQELNYEAFGTWGSHDREDFDDSEIGIGVGVNYFFTENFGVGADTYVEDIDLPNHLDLSLIGRLPLSAVPLAPYAFAGFGRQWSDVSQWTGHLGLGVEYRWKSKTGIFLDFREVFADKSKDISLFRLGVRCGF